MSPFKFADDMRRLYYDIKKFDRDIHTLYKMGLTQWGRADAPFSQPYADDTIVQKTKATYQNGGDADVSILSQRDGWIQDTVSFKQMFIQS